MSISGYHLTVICYLLSAFYLTHVDIAMAKNKHIYYARYMDDIIILSKTRWHLRKAIVQLNGLLQTLRFTQHPQKTFIGRIKRGFDWMGAQIDDKGIIGIAKRSIDNSTEKLSRLYEKIRAWNKDKILLRVAKYKTHWFRWARYGLAAYLSVTTAVPAVKAATIEIGQISGSAFSSAPIGGVLATVTLPNLGNNRIALSAVGAVTTSNNFVWNNLAAAFCTSGNFYMTFSSPPSNFVCTGGLPYGAVALDNTPSLGVRLKVGTLGCGILNGGYGTDSGLVQSDGSCWASRNSLNGGGRTVYPAFANGATLEIVKLAVTPPNTSNNTYNDTVQIPSSMQLNSCNGCTQNLGTPLTPALITVSYRYAQPTCTISNATIAFESHAIPPSAANNMAIKSTSTNPTITCTGGTDNMVHPYDLFLSGTAGGTPAALKTNIADWFIIGMTYNVVRSNNYCDRAWGVGTAPDSDWVRFDNATRINRTESGYVMPDIPNTGSATIPVKIDWGLCYRRGITTGNVPATGSGTATATMRIVIN